MEKTKINKLLEYSDSTYLDYAQSDKEKTLIADVFSLFSDSAEMRNKNYNNFDGLTLIEYIEDSYRRTTTNVDIRDGIEDWQATIHDPFTRNKVNAILGKVVAVLPSVEVQNRGDDDIRKAEIVSNLLEYAEEMEDYEDFAVAFLYEAIVKGTAIGYEGHEYKEKKIREVISGSGDEISVKETTQKTNRLPSKIIKLEDFYPSTVAVRNIKEMPYCFVRNVIPYSLFRQNFSMYSKYKYVAPKKSTYGDKEPRPYYADYVSDDVAEGSVEVLYYYNKEDDEFIISANGIWLNPIMGGDVEVTSPIPFNHKELPFFDIKFELFDTDFFYGKSLPDKLKNLQDVLNVLTNMLLDQSFLSIFTPILTNGSDSIEDDYLVPGRRSPIDTQGLPLRDAVMKLDVGTPSGWHQYILEYTRKIMEESSIDKVSSGQAGAGDRTTAQEIRVAADGVASMLGLFGRFIKTALKRKAFLKTKNILQFWTDSRYPVIEQVLGNGAGSDMKEIFSTFKVKGTILSNGKRGMKVIDFYRDASKRPTAKELSVRAAMSKLTNNMEVEYVAIDPSYIRELDIDIKLVPNRKSETVKDIDKALHLEKVRVYKTLFPGMTDDLELLAQTAEKFGDDPTKVISKDILNPKEEPGQTGMSTEPQNNLANNATRSMAGGEAGANSLVALQGQMLG
jgi:hypothetical protein